MTPDPTRRSLLATIGATVGGALAGCIGVPDGPSPRSGPSGGGSGGGRGFNGAATMTDTSWVGQASADAALEVLRVTTLDATGTGSLTWALDQTTDAPSVIVFEVGGVINLDPSQNLSIDSPRTWIAGQTAPNPGITITHGELDIAASECIVQHLRIRPGDEIDNPFDTGNAVVISGDHCLLDHCTATWGVDEGVSTGDTTNSSITNCIIAEGLYDSIHPEGTHSCGTLVHYDVSDFSIVGNLYAHNNRRHPYCQGNTSTVFANNYVYNYGEMLTHLGAGDGDTPPEMSCAGTVYEAGPDSDSDQPLVAYEGTLYMDDTISVPAGRDPTDGSQTMVDAPPLWPAGFDPLPSGQVRETVLASAGARPAERSPLDRQLVGAIRDGGGAIIDSQDEVGGYPTLDGTSRPVSVPEAGAGIPDWIAEFSTAVEVGGGGGSEGS